MRRIGKGGREEKKRHSFTEGVKGERLARDYAVRGADETEIDIWFSRLWTRVDLLTDTFYVEGNVKKDMRRENGRCGSLVFMLV